MQSFIVFQHDDRSHSFFHLHSIDFSIAHLATTSKCQPCVAAAIRRTWPHLWDNIFDIVEIISYLALDGILDALALCLSGIFFDFWRGSVHLIPWLLSRIVLPSSIQEERFANCSLKILAKQFAMLPWNKSILNSSQGFWIVFQLRMLPIFRAFEVSFRYATVQQIATDQLQLTLQKRAMVLRCISSIRNLASCKYKLTRKKSMLIQKQLLSYKMQSHCMILPSLSRMWPRPSSIASWIRTLLLFFDHLQRLLLLQFASSTFTLGQIDIFGFALKAFDSL